LQEKIEKTIAGVATDINKKPISETFVILEDEKGNLLDTFTTKNNGTYSFQVDTDKKYKLFGNKVNYIEGECSANTFGENTIVIANLVLLEEEVVTELVEGADLGKVLKLNNIYFDYNKSDIRPDAAIELDKIIKTMNENPNIVVELSSYADSRADKEFNQILSDARAKSTIKYIQEKISRPERITGKGYGETNPVNDCVEEGNVISDCTEAEFQKNRRTEFIVIKTKFVVTQE
jgi:outer membrane protein OmpA-like peptidoglycan-associated protein